MPARRAGGSRLHRVDRAHDRLGAQEASEAVGDDHRVLDGCQRARRAPRRRNGPAVQSLPAHETDHARQHSGKPSQPARGSYRRSAYRTARAALGDADDQSEELKDAKNMSDAIRDLARRAEVVIVGGGLAGLFCALKLAPRPVTVISAAPLGEGASTAWAQGGIAAALAEGDCAEAHAADTIAAGAGLVDEDIALSLAREAAGRIDDLLRYGVPFDRDLEGRLALGREAAHSARRIVHVRGDMAGKAIIAALTTAVRKAPSIRVIEGFVAEALLAEDNTVTGLQLRRLDEVTARPVTIAASAVVMATGGVGHLYAATTNPEQASGLGLAIAARAGVVIADPEFVQFHPTAIMIGRDPAPLATEALRGEGATLINNRGERFMRARHPLAELAPRDIVARGVFAEISAGRGAFLDAREAVGSHFAEKFPTVHASCLTAGIDPAKQPIPIAPAAHYHMGGIAVDARGRSSIHRLWAGGEVSSTGAHGANRLASNSLLEAVVFAARIAEDIAGSRISLPARLPA